MLTDPIAALATPPGRSALAVVRLSGSGVFAIAARVIPAFRVDPPRTARLARFVDPAGAAIDRGLYLVYPAPRSATGQDLVEFTCHGGLAVPARLLEALYVAGARPAAPGEFTRRAVLNGKLDLLQAEAVGDLIEASAPAQAGAAVHQLEGGLSRRIAGLREALLDLESLLAYEVDFPDEDDGPLPRDRIEARRAEVAGRIERLLASAPAGERLREGALVVLTGAPNAGKSSLFNALLGSHRALVTELAGTTRDAIEAHTDFLGWPVRLVDTAGMSDTPDRLEAMGMEVSRKYIAAADLVIRCLETDKSDETDKFAPSTDETDSSGGLNNSSASTVSSVLLVRTKSDLGAPSGPGLPVSSVTGVGIAELRRLAGERLFGARLPLADLEPALTRARHREALARAQAALAEAREHLLPGGDAVLVAHHVRQATRALDALVGAVDLEEILDRVFAGFCVGK
jgi:tRNA modification GTPase